MGWLGFVLVGGGMLAVWSGYQGVSMVSVISDVLQGRSPTDSLKKDPPREGRPESNDVTITSPSNPQQNG